MVVWGWGRAIRNMHGQHAWTQFWGPWLTAAPPNHTRCPLQDAPARALEWDLKLEELRPLVAEVASGASGCQNLYSSRKIVSYGMEWELVADVNARYAPPTSAPSARPVEVGLWVLNHFGSVPKLHEACMLTGLSYRLEAARAQPADGAGAQPRRPAGPARRLEKKREDCCRPGGFNGWFRFFPVLASGSVDDPALAPFVHTGPGGVKVLRLRAEVLGLE